MGRLHRPHGHEYHQCVRECNGQCLLCGGQLWGDSVAEWFLPSSSETCEPQEEHPMALPKRAAPAQKGMNPAETWVDPEFKEMYPSVYSFLYDVTYADGSLRKPGGLVVCVRMGVLTFVVNDNDRNLVCYLNATTWTEMLFKLEEGIMADSLDWRSRPPRPAGQIPPY